LALARIAALENPSTATRNLTKGIDPATFTEEANQAPRTRSASIRASAATCSAG
jgi:hypothetical protein